MTDDSHSFRRSATALDRVVLDMPSGHKSLPTRHSGSISVDFTTDPTEPRCGSFGGNAGAYHMLGTHVREKLVASRRYGSVRPFGPLPAIRPVSSTSAPYCLLRCVPGRATIDSVKAPAGQRERTVLLIGSIGPLGHLPASGTVTVAVVGIPLFWLMHDWPWIAYLAATLAVAMAAVWLHATGDRILAQKDSRKLVWDEVVGFLVAVAFVPFTWQLAVVAFVLERALDIVKVPPANWIEKHWPGGWGVVGDDIAAGLYTCAILHIAIYFRPDLCGPTG